ncbi:hypothetical protein SprV_0200859800 [Sparganum proliferum]
MLKLKLQDRIPDKEALERTRVLSVHAMLKQLQLRWSRHEGLPKQLLYEDVATGARQQNPRAPPSSITAISIILSTTSAATNTTAPTAATDQNAPDHPSTTTATSICGLGLILSSLRSHTHLAHQPGRSLANSPYCGWRTSTRSPKYTRRIRLHCPRCQHIFIQRMGLFGHMRANNSGIYCNIDTPNTHCTPTNSPIPSPINLPSTSAPTASTTTTGD